MWGRLILCLTLLNVNFHGICGSDREKKSFTSFHFRDKGLLKKIFFLNLKLLGAEKYKVQVEVYHKLHEIRALIAKFDQKKVTKTNPQEKDQLEV